MSVTTQEAGTGTGAPASAGTGAVAGETAGASTPEAQAGAAPATGTVAEPKAGESAQTGTATAAPEIELKLPEGMQGGQSFESFKGLVKELGLPTDTAQKLVDFVASNQKAAVEAQRAEVERTQKTWIDSLKADKEIGGQEFDSNIQVARKAVERFGSGELKAFLEETGLGNHPAMVRAFYRIGKAIAEDSISGTSNGAPAALASSDEAFYRSLYPNTPQFFKE